MENVPDPIPALLRDLPADPAPGSCPSPASWADAAGAPEHRETLLDHAAGCVVCAGRLELWAELGEGAQLAARPVPAWRRLFPRVAVAAGLLAAIGAGTWIALGRREPSEPRTTQPLPEGTRRFAGGVMARAASGLTVLSEAPPGSGERLRLRLDQGEASLDIPPGSGTVRLDTPAGSVRVIGTAFTARVIRFPFPERTLATAVVEVTQGRVAVSTGRGEVQVGAGHRAVCIEGHPPIGPIQLEEPPPSGLPDALRRLAALPDPAADPWALLPFLNLHRTAAGILFEEVRGARDARLREFAARCAVALGHLEEQEKLKTEVPEAVDWIAQGWPHATR